jgi:F-type H+-transporting ATPase subunit c
MPWWRQVAAVALVVWSSFIVKQREEKVVMADVVNLGHLAAGFGAGAVTVGAAYGIGRIAGAAMEGSARNPQAAGDVRTSMIIACALIEGVALFGEVICLLLALK